MTKLAFWFDYASTYSYLSAVRVEALAAAAGLELDWRPFLLGPIFKAQGWTSSPFNLYPAKGRYMLRDMERICRERGLAFAMPKAFPANSLHAARVGLVARAEGWAAGFTKGVYEAEFARGSDIAEEAILATIISACGHDPDRVFFAARSEQTKSGLRTATEHAATLGIFGAPTFVTDDGEVFWGDDRLEQAIAWACEPE